MATGPKWIEGSSRKESLEWCRAALVEGPVAEDWGQHGEETRLDAEVLPSAVQQLRHRGGTARR